MLTLDLGTREEKKSCSANVKLPLSPLTHETKLPNIEPENKAQSLQQVFEGISTSKVSSRLSELHQEQESRGAKHHRREESVVSIQVTTTAEMASLEMERSESSCSESSMRQHLGSTCSDRSLEERGKNEQQTSGLQTAAFEGSELTSPNNTTNADEYDVVNPEPLEEDDILSTREHKPIPKHRQLIKINSTDLLHRNIKETMIEQVMCEDDDSVMSESAITAQKTEFEDRMSATMFKDSAISLGGKGSSDPLSSEFNMEDEINTAQETFVEEPDWEIVDQEKESGDEAKKRAMTPEQALEIANEVVSNVQSEAVKRYEELVKNQSFPKPTPDSKFTPETKEKVQVYLKELEESEEYDHVAAELITNVVTKKEERLSKMNQMMSVEITDEEPRSDAMLSELRNELGRSSVTDEDLVTDITHELLEERNIEEMRRHLELAVEKYEFQVPSDFKFQSSFRSHFVREHIDKEDAEVSQDIESGDLKIKGEGTDSDSKSSSGDEDKKETSVTPPEITEDIWAEESKSVQRKERIVMREKRSDTESQSSGYRKSGTDHEGYSSSGGETFFTAEHLTSRPTSSDVDVMLSAVSEHSSATENTEFLTAQDHSSADTSFFTAASTLSSRDSVISSESSGHLGSVEVSECSETLVESNMDFDPHHDGSDTPSTFKHLDEAMEEPFTGKQPEAARRKPADAPVSSVTEIRQQLDSPQEIQLLNEDDVDGCCFSRLDKDDSENEPLMPAEKERFGSMFSESRETLSSSVLTLSSVSEATVVGLEKAQLRMISSQSTETSEMQKQADILSASLISMSDSSSMSSSLKVEQPVQDEESTQGDQVFPLPRVRATEGAHTVQIAIPQEVSLDLGSEYDSRPNSELRNVESRPMSAEKLSRSVTPEDLLSGPLQKRAFSIDDTVSEGLRVIEPFARPISPMPSGSRPGSESEDRKLKPALSAPGRSVSPSPMSLLSKESIEAELAFSQHFTEVLDDCEYETNEIIKTNENENVILTTGPLMDLTPESVNTSESLEQSQDCFIEHDNPDYKARSPKIPYDLDDTDDLIVGSPPMVTRPLGVKYWPPVDNLDQEEDAGPMDKRSMARSESDDNSESRLDIDNDLIEKEVEQGKRWLENQFEEVPDEYGNFSYGQPLDQILEEEEDRESHSSEDMKELARFKESISSTPDFDAIVSKKHALQKSLDPDDLSLGSLTEFERLERDVADLGSGSISRGSLGSNDSLEASGGNGNGGKPSNLAVKLISKSGHGDDVSVSSENSLKSFEMMEKACREAAEIEAKAKHQEEVLSEIEEGHESQVSESDTCETVSECGEKSDEEDYEDRIFEIDNIIKQAQENVEKFDKPAAEKTEKISLSEILGRPESKTESVSSHDSLDDIPNEIPKEEPHIVRQSSLPTRLTSAVTSRTTSATSLYSATSAASASTLTQYDPDSICERDLEIDEYESMMQASVDSLDPKVKSPENQMVTSTDSLEPNTPRTADKMTISTDSIENGKSTDPMTVSVDSLEGNSKDVSSERSKDQTLDMAGGATSLWFTSTDSIESGSTNTRATASMLSSITSQGSETLVADDEFELDDDDSRSARKYLLNQGNLHFDDSDDSTTYSHSSPQPSRVFQRDLSDSPVTKYQRYPRPEPSETYISSEEVVETEEVDEKGNIVVKKVIQKRVIVEDPKQQKVKLSGYISDVSEKKDDSCEETIEEVDEFGTKKLYVVKRSIETKKPTTLEVVRERRELQGLSPIGEMYKPIAQKPQQPGAQ